MKLPAFRYGIEIAYRIDKVNHLLVIITKTAQNPSDFLLVLKCGFTLSK